MTIYVYMPPTGDEDRIFGRGMSVITGQPVGQTCVTGLTTTGEPSLIGTDATNYSIVEDSASYDNLLTTAASMSGSGLCWSASASSSYLRQQTGSDTSISLVWLRMIQSQAIYADASKAVISDAAINLLKTQGPGAFVDQYGTHCAIGVVYGGSFIGRFRVDTSTATDKETIAASVKGSLSGFGVSGSASASFEQDLNSTSTHYQATLEANGTGTGIIPFASFDLAGVKASLAGFKLPHDAGRNVDGAAVATICQTWDQFPQIAAALAALGQPEALQFTAEQATLDELGGEFDALAYIENTASSLIDSNGYAIPPYRAMLLSAAATAAGYRAQIQGLSMDQISRLTVQGLGPYLVSAKMMPLIGVIAHGQVLVRVSWQLDGAFFGDIVDTADLATAPNQGYQQVGDFNHNRPEGSDPPQHMTLYYAVNRDDGGNGSLSVKMHWRDPYGPPNDADYYGDEVALTGFPAGTSTANWGLYPWNQMSATLAGFDPSIQILSPAALEEIVAAVAETVTVVAELVD